MTVREQTERLEAAALSPFACLSRDTRGRARPEEPCPIRTAFARDRDRIIHCKAFRRLRLKTQVFLAPEGDHYRTRLTHTLEVSQIARTVARALRLNEDLTEAIALGHDLGHTPFGHAGERAIRAIDPDFHHAAQSVRVTELYEKGGRGLNLCLETQNGMEGHTRSRGLPLLTREAAAVQLCDRIAYINHDIEDAVRAGIIADGDVPRELCDALGYGKSERITALVTDAIGNGAEHIGLTPAVAEAFDALYRFMYDRVYLNPTAKAEEQKVEGLIRGLYGALVKHPERLPEEYAATAERDGPSRAACDYISGMTDAFLVAKYEELFIPRSWSVL